MRCRGRIRSPVLTEDRDHAVELRNALIDFLPVRSTDGRRCHCCRWSGVRASTSPSAPRGSAPRQDSWAAFTDLFGRMIADHAKASQVELRYATRSGHQTTLAFVRSVNGEPQYAFYDEGRHPGTGPIAAVPLHSTRSRPSMSVRQPSSMKGPRPKCWRWSKSPWLSHHIIRSELQAQSRPAQGPLCRADGRVCRQRSHCADVGCRL